MSRPTSRTPSPALPDSPARVADISAIAITGLTVTRGGHPVLRDLTCTVPRRSVTGLLGPSGSGKTTLMRALVGVQSNVTGTVMVLGQPAGSTGLRRKVGYVTQSPAVYGDLSVRENLRYFADVLGAPDGHVAKVLAEVSLTRQSDQLVSTLSGGERARVSLGSALLGDPELLVLDEPTVGLDPVLRRDLWELFHDLAGNGATLLVSSHVMDEAARCDRLLLMREGRLVADDTPEGLLASTGAANVEDAFLRLVEGDAL